MMTHDEMIAVIQAHKEGKTIQYRCGDEWGVARSPTWDFKSTEYRVKPEPLVLWVNYNSDGAVAYRSKKEATYAASSCAIRRAVKMVEADEDD